MEYVQLNNGIKMPMLGYGVYQVTKDQKDYYVPVIADVVIEKDIDGGVVKIRPMKGIFDDED